MKMKSSPVASCPTTDCVLETAPKRQTPKRQTPTPKRQTPKRQTPSPKSSTVVVCGALALLAVAVLAAYHLHIPLPADFTDRPRMQLVEFVMRLVYFYPVRLLAPFGAHTQLRYARRVLSGFSQLLAHWSSHDPDMTIYESELDTVPVRIFAPHAALSRGNGAVVFFHGGGFVLGNVADYDSITRDLARRSGLIVFSVEYRLAPEHVYPAGLEDCERSVMYLLQNAEKRFGVDPSQLVLMGDSAGGNIVAVLSGRLRDQRAIAPLPLPEIKLQVLIYPLLQYLDFLTPSYQLYYAQYDGTAFMDPESLARWILMYLGIDVDHHQWIIPEVLSNNHHMDELRLSEQFEYRDHYRLPDQFLNATHYRQPAAHSALSRETLSQRAYDLLEPFLMDPEFSPLFRRNLTGMPTTLVLTCEYDILRDEGVMYAHRLREEGGVNATWRHYDTAFHAILNFHQHLTLAQDMLQDIADYIHEHLD